MTPQKIKRTQTIAQMALQGVPSRKIAKQLKISNDTVWRSLKTDIAKQILEACQQIAIIEGIRIQQRFIDLTMSDDQAISLAAIKQWHKITNQSPSAVQNNYIQTIYQDNRQQIINPAVAEALSGTCDDSDTVDAEIVDG